VTLVLTLSRVIMCCGSKKLKFELGVLEDSKDDEMWDKRDKKDESWRSETKGQEERGQGEGTKITLVIENVSGEKLKIKTGAVRKERQEKIPFAMRK
jgi:hypothetical protein